MGMVQCLGIDGSEQIGTKKCTNRTILALKMEIALLCVHVVLLLETR